MVAGEGGNGNKHGASDYGTDALDADILRAVIGAAAGIGSIGIGRGVPPFLPGAPRRDD